MNRYRWRIRATSALLMSVIVATGILTQTAAVSAVGTGSMDWTGSRWEDPVCDTANEVFDVSIYRDASYGGTEWRLCGWHQNLCMSPYGQDSPSAALCLNAGYDGETANDYASSMKVRSIAGGSTCRVKLFEHANYGGGAIVEFDPVNRTSLFPYNDAISSVKRVC
jgi:hypothetical protein